MALRVGKIAVVFLPEYVLIHDVWGNTHKLEVDEEAQAYYYKPEDSYYSSVQMFLNYHYSSVPHEEIVLLTND